MKIRFLFSLLFCFITVISFGQTVNDAPKINYFYSDTDVSREPDGCFLKLPAEYYGVEITYGVTSFQKADGTTWTRDSSEKSIKKYYVDLASKIKQTFPESYFYSESAKFLNIEFTDKSILDFININENASLKMFCLIKLDTSKTERQLINEFFKLKKLITLNRIPKQTPKYSTDNGYEFLMIMNSLPILANSSIETYNNKLLSKITKQLNKLSSEISGNQQFEVTINDDVKISRASLFNLYYKKKYTLQFKSTN
ncbi:hypothetical protein OD91_0537 [Lutibacter sp. Hel_I_33_5]|uniref:hypothetical protein n=1 Tax=Lutibacter sp. Hel_I_33_5 TaxID=1566289 RepID=UPI0011A8C113|nr:hypothetical protein [Lutibacter sp. Hel_I_33_5]TVZ55291.1 hypothetical protein OD91_0537 [Lutibacter sp. Hel_I_33_5]